MGTKLLRNISKLLSRGQCTHLLGAKGIFKHRHPFWIHSWDLCSSMPSVWSPWLPFTLLIISKQHVRTHLNSTYQQMFVEDQLFPWYLGLGICVGMCGVSQTLGSQLLLIYNLDSLHLLSLSRISWCCSDIFTHWVLIPYYKLQGLRNSFLWPDCTHLYWPFVLCVLPHFRVIFKEALVISFPHSKSMR